MFYHLAVNNHFDFVEWHMAFHPCGDADLARGFELNCLAQAPAVDVERRHRTIRDKTPTCLQCLEPTFHRQWTDGLLRFHQLVNPKKLHMAIDRTPHLFAEDKKVKVGRNSVRLISDQLRVADDRLASTPRSASTRSHRKCSCRDMTDCARAIKFARYTRVNFAIRGHRDDRAVIGMDRGARLKH